MTKRICSVAGCTEKHRAKGFCTYHYDNFRNYGDPLHEPSRARNGVALAFVEILLTLDDNECIIWPFGYSHTTGYGCIRAPDSPNREAHRYICRKAHGECPTPKHEVRHLCGNRACVNPKHLSWGTKKQNEEDKLVHGTRLYGEQVGNAKLTESDVREIKQRLENGERQESIAKLFGVTSDNISCIKRGISWRHVN